MISFSTYQISKAFDFGNIEAPIGVEKYGAEDPGGLIILLSNLFKLILVGAGLFTLVSLVLAAFEYIGSNANPETLKSASSRIWMSMLGLAVIGSSFILAALFGQLFFGDATAIIQPAFPEI